MASSRSERAVEAPCIGVPPAMEIFVVAFLPLEGPGVEVRETGLDLGLGLPRSETKVPWADGGGFGVGCFCAVGFGCGGGGGLLGPPACSFDGVVALDDLAEMYSRSASFLL